MIKFCTSSQFSYWRVIGVYTDKSLCMLAASEAMLNRLNDESRSLDIRINDKSLNQVSEHPYLGIYIHHFFMHISW